MSRQKSIVVGTDEKGEFIWSLVPMAYWEMVMFPLRYVGDFKAFWMKAKMLVDLGYEMEEGISADFQSWVPGPLAKKYAAKRGHHKGD